MKLPYAILVTLGLLGIFHYISTVIHFDIWPFLLIGSGFWVAYDSTQIEITRYQSPISHGPVVLFIICVVVWIVCFPWYLVLRYKITTGTAVLK